MEGTQLMLVLSRRLNEKIVFPGLDISVQIVNIKPGGAVRLGIEAPRAVTVLREEIPDRTTEWGAPVPQNPEQEAAGRFYKLNQTLRHRLKAVNADLKV